MFIGIPPIVNDKPVTLNAYARWTGISSGDSYNVIETFRLRRNQTDTGWSGASSRTGHNLSLDILDTDDPTEILVRLLLREEAWPIDHHEWPVVDIRLRPPWGSETLTYVDPPGYELLQVQILA